MIAHGEGEPPDKAKMFRDFLYGKRAPELARRVSRVGLGDLSYTQFCQTGSISTSGWRNWTARACMPAASATWNTRTPPRRGCRACWQPWGRPHAGGAAAPLRLRRPRRASRPGQRSRPFPAEVLENIKLSGRGSDKEMRHLKLALEGSAFDFEPGDAMGIYPQNHPRWWPP